MLPISNLPSVDPNALIEDLGNSIKRHWLFNRSIVIYEVGSATRNAVDTWTAAVIQDADAWPRSQPYLAMHYTVGLTVTPYGNQRTEAMAKAIPRDLHGRYATVISRTIFGVVIRNLLANRLSKLVPNLSSGIHFSFEEALAWLRQ